MLGQTIYSKVAYQGMGAYPKTVILVGDPGVGKTSFMVRLLKGIQAKKPRPTIGVEYETTVYQLRENAGTATVQIWDTG